MPLHSTRADVEKLLGASVPLANEHVSRHETESEVVVVEYATGPPCGTDGLNMWQVPRDTVIGILVSPKAELRFNDLHLDETKYEKTDGGHVPNYIYYTDRKEGVNYEVTHGLVLTVSYFPAAKDNYLMCPAARRKPSS